MTKLRYITLLALFVLGIASISAQDEAKVAITLERTACFGACPVYTLSILEDGTVIYNGGNFVDVTGEQRSQIDPETVNLMVTTLIDAGYFDWNETYDSFTVSDQPSVITSLTHDGKTHQINRYAGDSSAPLILPYLEQWIDAMANSQQWTGHAPIVYSRNSPMLTLQRDPCFGMCPVYNLALFDDGTIVYSGFANVDHIGVHIYKTDPLAITSIVQRATALGYFDWEDAYDTQVMTDQSTVTTSIQTDDQFKRIVRYNGDPNAPIGLMWVEDMIDQAVPQE